MLKEGIHRVVRLFRLEGAIGKIGKRFPFFKRMNPLHDEYSPQTLRLVKRNSSKFLLDISDYMQWYVYTHEPDISWKVALQYAVANSVVLDIGANVGQFSIPLSNAIASCNLQCRVVAFEPNPEIFKALNQNIQLNPNVHKVVTTIPLALSHTIGENPFIYGMRNSGAGRFSDIELSDITVQVTIVDEFVKNNLPNTPISFIKIDVEGYEPEVIIGATQTIRTHMPVIYFEFSPTWCNQRGVDPFLTLKDLSRLGYKMLYEKGECLIEVDSDFGNLISVYQTNILAIPSFKIS